MQEYRQDHCAHRRVAHPASLFAPSIIQFRPVRFSVDSRSVRAAREVYGKLVPRTGFLGHRTVDKAMYQVTSMELMPGINVSKLKPYTASLDHLYLAKILRLLEDLAETFALSWHRPQPSAQCNGIVGRSLRDRLVRLGAELPDRDLRKTARQAVGFVDMGWLDLLPSVLIHGDLIPSNLLCCPDTGELLGIVDWAEAKILPFGLALYYVEHLTGYWSAVTTTFVYHEQSRSVPSFE